MRKYNLALRTARIAVSVPRCAGTFKSPITKPLFSPDCGTREALESIGVKEAEQEKILATIHHAMEG